MNSATVADNQDATAAQYNNLRKDVVQLAGDYATSSGSANAYVLAVDAQIVSAYVEGTVFKFKANFANTGAATLNVNTLGAKTIKKNYDQDLAQGDIKSGQLVIVMYDGTNLQMLSEKGNPEHTIQTLNAGETINGATLPVAIFVNDSDDEVYACDGNDTTKLNFDGFAISNSTDGNPISIQNNGIVRGFSGLDIGKKYYVQDDKTIGTTVGTYVVVVGIAVSTTELLIYRTDNNYNGFIYASASDTLQASADTERNKSNDDTYTKVKEIKTMVGGVIRVKFDGESVNANGYIRIYKNGIAFGTEQNPGQGSYTTYSEDLFFIAGDLIQIYYKTFNLASDIYVKNFRLYYTKNTNNKNYIIVTN